MNELIFIIGGYVLLVLIISFVDWSYRPKWYKKLVCDHNYEDAFNEELEYVGRICKECDHYKYEWENMELGVNIIIK